MKKALCILLIVLFSFSIFGCKKIENAYDLEKSLHEQGYYLDIANTESEIEELAEMLGISAQNIECFLFYEADEQGLLIYCQSKAKAEQVMKDLYADGNDLDTIKLYFGELIETEGKIVYIGTDRNWRNLK